MTALEDAALVQLNAQARQAMILRAEQVAAGEVDAYVIDKDGYFTSLPQEYYISEEIFAQDIKKVFNRQWIYAGQTSQVRKPGDFYVRTVGTESLIITRDKEGELHAFFNLCRHRGSRICGDGEEGNRKRFTCPYHSWSFGLDGRLSTVPGARNGTDFDFAGWGLHEAKSGSYHGSIFVFIGEEEPELSLHDYISASSSTPDTFESLQTERTKIAAARSYPVAANWKTMLENNSECYHCPGTHPSLCSSVNVALNYLTEEGNLSDDVDPDLFFQLNEGQKTMSGDGDWVCKKPLGDGMGDRFSAGFAVGPTFGGAVYFSDYGILISVEPITVDTSRLICEWVVHEDAVEGVDYDVPSLMEVWDNTNREDIALAEGTYRGVKSARYVPGPNIARREPLIRAQLVKYLEMLEK